MSLPAENQSTRSRQKESLSRSDWECQTTIITMREPEGHRPLWLFKQTFNAYLTQTLQTVWASHYQMENHPFLLVFALNLEKRQRIIKARMIIILISWDLIFKAEREPTSLEWDKEVIIKAQWKLRIVPDALAGDAEPLPLLARGDGDRLSFTAGLMGMSGWWTCFRGGVLDILFIAFLGERELEELLPEEEADRERLLQDRHINCIKCIFSKGNSTCRHTWSMRRRSTVPVA